MPGQQKHLLIARDHYDDIDLAVRELGSLWVLDLINKTLAHSKIARERLRTKRRPEDSRYAFPPSKTDDQQDG